jgi:hypothetical protein
VFNGHNAQRRIRDAVGFRKPFPYSECFCLHAATFNRIAIKEMVFIAVL